MAVRYLSFDGPERQRRRWSLSGRSVVFYLILALGMAALALGFGALADHFLL